MPETATLSREQGELVHNALANTVVKHIQAHDMLGPLNYNPENLTFQSFDVVHLPVCPVSADSLRELAKIANSRLFYASSEVLCSQQASEKLRKIRNSQKPMVVVSNHQSVTDMPVTSVGVTLHEHDPERSDWVSEVAKNGLIVGRAMTTLQAFGLPVIDIVAQGGDVFLSTPRTSTISTLVRQMPDVKLPTIINNSNSAMRFACKQWLNETIDRRLFIALPGRTDIVQGDVAKPDHISIGKAHPAVCDIVQNSTVLPIVSWDRGPDKDAIFVMGEPTIAKTATDLERIERWQQQTLANCLGIHVEQVSLDRPLAPNKS